MTQEEKSILLKDLCARFPYGVICCVTYKKNSELVKEDMKLSGIFEDGIFYFLDKIGSTYSDKYIPYLRPMSSMTKEEEEEYQAFFNYDGVEYPEAYIDWLNEHHFDYNDLISKSLALKAPENMYNN